MSRGTPAGLVLAAGAGRRFGGPKALARVDAELLVERAIRVLAEGGCDPVLVVLGAAAEQVVADANLDGAVTLVNDGWEEGMGSSLRCGLTALTHLPAPAVVVMLVDMPGVTADGVRRVVDAWPGGRAVVATYGGRRRHPVLLDRSTWAGVAAGAVAETGARAWLREHAEEVVEVACDDLGDARDIDTADDLARLLEEPR
jgi:CTP:molybdopterin cytidylyltransferase MocA